MRISESVTVVARHFADYINRVAFRGERFILMRGNKPVAELCPVPMGSRLGDLSNVVASLPRLSEGEAVAFATGVESAREELKRATVRDPWES